MEQIMGEAGTGTFGRIVLWMLILWAAMQLGGGLYEKQAVIPTWASEIDPATLSQRLAESGHTRSGTRFWPFISPVVFLLAIVNFIVAWRSGGPERPWWLFSSATLVLMSISTYSYFVPTMLSFMHRASSYTLPELQRSVSLWLSLSTIRMLVAVPALLAAMRAMTLIASRSGGACSN